MTVGGRVGALWIGGLEPYMDEAFLQNAMNMMGESGVVSIKVMTNKFTGEPAGYGFINFDSDQTAIIAMHRLGGKIIPNSNPPVRFKLNHNSTRLQPGEADTSIWVGDLTPEVDDFALYRFFTQRYGSIRCAKVVLDESGFSKGYGFVRFGSEAEQQHALGSMTGEMGLGSKPIKVSMANQKNRAENGEGEMFGGGSMGGLTGPAPGGGVSPPSATWGGVSAWPAQSSGGASGWPGQASGAQPGGSWPGIGGGVSSPTSGGSGGPPAAATSPGPDYSAYHQYYQQYAHQQQQQYAAAWSAWQQAQQQQQQQP
eukprot:TRINITY_DN5348_c0_g1_i1.p1 TRINITY_DN5348_c0_g1~~TRINITY_DN5348_c0_g1_i1.p1  ORF type:complete len:312 (+),score=113.52 TRINITY_DN5348_c0_g1_i1:135-1070(+)